MYGWEQNFTLEWAADQGQSGARRVSGYVCNRHGEYALDLRVLAQALDPRWPVARTPPDSLGGHVDPWGPCAPRGGNAATECGNSAFSPSSMQWCGSTLNCTESRVAPFALLAPSPLRRLTFEELEEAWTQVFLDPKSRPDHTRRGPVSSSRSFTLSQDRVRPPR